MSRQVSMQFGKPIVGVNQGESTGSGAVMTLLWTNPSQTTTFAAQTVSLDLADYDAVIIIYRINTTTDLITGNVYTPVGTDARFRYITNSGTNLRAHQRDVTVTATGCVFSDNIYVTQGSSGTTTSNTVSVPRNIYGIKFG